LIVKCKDHYATSSSTTPPSLASSSLSLSLSSVTPRSSPSSLFSINPSAPWVRSYFSSTSANFAPSNPLVPYWLGAIPFGANCSGITQLWHFFFRNIYQFNHETPVLIEIIIINKLLPGFFISLPTVVSFISNGAAL
jgi:hypothetical protein